jgi:hypothetical protein
MQQFEDVFMCCIIVGTMLPVLHALHQVKLSLPVTHKGAAPPALHVAASLFPANTTNAHRSWRGSSKS